jgi:NADH-quinone oxidoreductase subunit N
MLTLTLYIFNLHCIKLILVFWIFLKNIFLDSFFYINFYIEIYYIEIDYLFELLPELMLILYISYNLISIFNDLRQSNWQYYRWLILYCTIFFLLICKWINISLIPIQILFGWNWINCLYVIVSKLIIITLTIIVLWIAKSKIHNSVYLNCGIEFPLVISFALLFMFLLTSSYNFFAMYLSIEGLSLTLYVLGGILYQSIISIEGILKYFSIGAISAGVLLFGISIIFAITGSLDYLEIQLYIGSYQLINYFTQIKVGILFVLIGFLFKIASFPFHIWIADVYEGVWTPITAFFAIVVKVCLVLFIIRLVCNVLFNILFCFQIIISVSAIGSMLIGSVGAIKQVKIKRFIAYTSINQIGFILLGISSGNLIGMVSCVVYIILYAIMGIIFFSILLNTIHLIHKRNMVYLSDLYSFSMYNNSSKYIVITLLSMCGLPPMGGFVGKLLLYISAIQARLDLILLISLCLSIVSTYYYLSFVRYILFEKRCNLKLYYYINKKNYNHILQILSIVLILFTLIFPYLFSIAIIITVSCMWPFIWY